MLTDPANTPEQLALARLGYDDLIGRSISSGPRQGPPGRDQRRDPRAGEVGAQLGALRTGVARPVADPVSPDRLTLLSAGSAELLDGRQARSTAATPAR
jgi:hypothetical protein